MRLQQRSSGYGQKHMVVCELLCCGLPHIGATQACTKGTALLSMQDVKAERSIAIHHGTFGWDSGPMDEPRHLLKQAAAAAQLPQNTFTCVQHGAILQVPGEEQ